MKQMLNYFNSILKAQNFSNDEIQKLTNYFVSEEYQKDEELKDVKFSNMDLVYFGERLPSLNKAVSHNFLVYLINRKRFDVIIAFLSKVFVAHIDKFCYQTKDVERMSNLERTFDRFIEFCMWTDIPFSMWQDEFFNALITSSGPLQNWKRPAKSYLLNWLKKDEKDFFDFTFQNFSKYGIIVFGVLFEQNVESAAPKLLDYYLNNEFNEKRQVKNILKQHYNEINEFVLPLVKAGEMSEEKYVQTLLIFSYKKEALNTLLEVFEKTKDKNIKKLIIENSSIKLPEKTMTLSQAKKNSQKYSAEFNFLGFNESEFLPLTFVGGEEAPKSFVNFFLSSYSELVSPKAFEETAFFKNLLDETSLNEFCHDLAQKIAKMPQNEQSLWALTLIAQNISINMMENIIYLFVSQKDCQKISKEFIKELVLIQTDNAQKLFNSLNKEERKQKVVLDTLLQAMIESEKYDYDTIELLRDKMVPNFNLSSDGKIVMGDCVISIEKDFSVSISGQENPPQSVLLEKKKLEREVLRQIKRLKSFYHSGRMFNKEDWQKNVLGNNLMLYLAKGLLWGRYDKDNLISVFKIDEKGLTNLSSISKIDVDYKIGLFHPVEFSELDWHSVFNAKKSPFNQLDVAVFSPTNFNVHSFVVSRFNGFMVNSQTFFKRMQDFGWQFGLLSVDKMATSMVKLSKELKILAEISFSPAKTDEDSTISLGELRFYKLDDTLRTGNNFITNKTKSMEIGLLKPRYFSDIIYEITIAGKK